LKTKKSGCSPSNAEIAELFSIEAEDASYILQRAYRRAARSAFLWPAEASELVSEKRSLEELRHVGPTLAKKIRRWIKNAKRPGRPPELRRDFLTLAGSRRFLQKHNDWRKRLRGDLQMHTTWSDGSGTIREMAEAAIARGHEYIAITDHSKGLSIANGLSEGRLAQQRKEIDRVNRELKSSGTRFTVLRSTEMNLDPTGRGDMAPSALQSLDIVLGSFHSALRRTQDQTERYLAALRNPHIQILGHPRGRIYNYRLGLRADWKKVFREAARLDKAVESDAYPDRQDLNVSLLKLAAKAGTRISFGTDAHHPWQLEFIDLALAAALKAKVAGERVVNFMSADDLRGWVKTLRGRG